MADHSGDDASNSGSAPASQRKVFVQRELDRMKHVINRLQLQESRNAKRAQIAELKAKEVESVRQESERDARIREQVMIEERDRQLKQHERIAAVRQDRRQRAESTRRDLRQKKIDSARVTKEQHKFIKVTLSESNAEHHDRCIAQHNAIRAIEKSGSTARARTVEKKRKDVNDQSIRNKNEIQTKEQELQALMEKAEALKRKVDESKSVEYAAHARLQDLCSGGSKSATGQNSPSATSAGARGHHNNSHSSSRGAANNNNNDNTTASNNDDNDQSRGTTASGGEMNY